MKRTSRNNSVGSDDSLVLIESSDALPPSPPVAATVTTGQEEDAVRAEQEPLMLSFSSCGEEVTPIPPPSPPAVTKAFSCDIQDKDLEEQQGTATPEEAIPMVTKDGDEETNPSSNTSPTKAENQDEGPREEVTRERKVGAGITIGLIAAPFCGPMLAIAAGVAAAFGTSQPGAAGDVCRAAGDIAMVAKEKAMEVDQKHHIVDKTKEGAHTLVDRAKNMNEQHQILERLMEVIVSTLKNVVAVVHFAAEKMRERTPAAAEATTASSSGRAAQAEYVDECFAYSKVHAGN